MPNVLEAGRLLTGGLHPRRRGVALGRPYGGAVVKWHGLMAIVWLVVCWWLVWLRFARRPGRWWGSRRVVMLIFGGWPKTSVRRTSAV